MKITQLHDKVTIDDAELQRVLKAYIELQTRRTVRGDVDIDTVRAVRMGRVRELEYIATCLLEDEPVKEAP